MAGIQILAQRLTDDALATLASITALIIDTVMTGITINFLLKKVRAGLTVEGLTSGDSVIMGLCSGNMTIADIAAVMNASILGPAETDEAALTK